MATTVAVSGDSIINRRVSRCEEPDFLELAELFRGADLGFTHLETNLLDYGDPGVYPAAEAGGTWMRSPPHVAEELRWAGFDMVSHASNHALDYGIGGLEATWAALDAADVSHAGTGRDLADARLPTYREVPGARVALVSMTTSCTTAMRAGEARRDMQGRPGVNPLAYRYAAGPDYIERVTDLAREAGWWITPEGDEWVFNPPGLHNTVTRVTEAEQPGLRRVLDGDDRTGNLQAVAEGDRQADVTIAHVHTHAWKADGELKDPPAFLQSFARDCLDVGADLVVCQGSHTPLRGIERHGDGVIFYDPGDLFSMAGTTERLPAAFFDRYGDGLEDPAGATPGEGLAARGLPPKGERDDEATDDSAYGGRTVNPPGGYYTGDVLGLVVPVCTITDDGAVERVELHPGTLRDSPTLYDGVPVGADGERARAILEHVDELSTPFGTDVSIEDDVGYVAG